MSGFDRRQKRTEARRLYEKFSAKWHEDLRISGRYGKPNTRKPPFSSWYAMHLRDVGQMRESTPQDVQEYLQLGDDTWEEKPPQTMQELYDGPAEEERGVMTIPIFGSEDDR